MMTYYTFKFVKQARFYDSGISNKNTQDEGYFTEEFKKKGKAEPGVRTLPWIRGMKLEEIMQGVKNVLLP